MTDEQKEICERLGAVKYLPASFDKRLGQNLCGMAELTPGKELSEKQNEWMYRLLYKYRKQLPHTYNKYQSNEFCNKKNRTKNDLQ